MAKNGLKRQKFPLRKDPRAAGFEPTTFILVKLVSCTFTAAAISALMRLSLISTKLVKKAIGDREQNSRKKGAQRTSHRWASLGF